MLTLPRWQTWTITGTVVLSLLLALPNLLPTAVLNYLPQWYAANIISLGLDLRGGAHLLFDVDVRSVVRQRLTDLSDSIRTELRKQQLQVREIASDGTSLTVSLRDAADAARIADIIRNLESGLLDVTTVAPTTLRVAYTQQELTRRRQQVLDQSIEVVRKRVDETGTKEPTIQRQGDERVLVQVPGVENPDDLIKLISTTAKMEFRLEGVGATILRPSKEGWDAVWPELAKSERWQKESNKTLIAEEICRRQATACMPVSRRVVVSGEELTDAQATFDQQTNRPIVSFRFTTSGGRAFCRATTDNINKPLAIVLDERVISAPVIQSAICGGSGIITGNFTSQQTNDLALQLRSGALPATLTVIERRTVGADLGADAIRAGTIAAVVGTALVVLFMFMSYGPTFGGFANLAMAVNLLMVFAGMSVLGASLTLPGIAGLVLTVGMAVDSNVLIYERVREEQSLGRSAMSALTAGYERAMSAIIDANLTTLIAGVLMFGFGSGPIKGFATTLSLGLLTSMFSSTIFTRMVLAQWMRWRRPRELVI
ncbi:protein translocase subunit SecD [Vineibacter terrae]|uniref:protein translocase subunit SecD n=1 Tax=Vineibacter terrae TaxID=2586908 RepID=UPI002E301951|nr:protein translocase subunit SecD [Vineibacter terrae]HEX2890772.1 protein translocase subunit SecD [Vineibacter terrae]